MEHEREQRVKRTQGDYSFAFKMMVVHEVEKGQITYKQAQAKYGIQGRSTVLVWLRKHGQQDWTSNMPTSSKTPINPPTTNPPIRKAVSRRKLKRIYSGCDYHIDKECGTDLGKKYTEHVSKIGKAKED